MYTRPEREADRKRERGEREGGRGRERERCTSKFCFSGCCKRLERPSDGGPGPDGQAGGRAGGLAGMQEDYGSLMSLSQGHLAFLIAFDVAHEFPSSSSDRVKE